MPCTKAADAILEIEKSTVSLSCSGEDFTSEARSMLDINEIAVSNTKSTSMTALGVK